jgi:hypothetical protein
MFIMYCRIVVRAFVGFDVICNCSIQSKGSLTTSITCCLLRINRAFLKQIRYVGNRRSVHHMLRASAAVRDPEVTGG